MRMRSRLRGCGVLCGDATRVKSRRSDTDQGSCVWSGERDGMVRTKGRTRTKTGRRTGRYFTSLEVLALSVLHRIG